MIFLLSALRRVPFDAFSPDIALVFDDGDRRVSVNATHIGPRETEE